MELDNQKVEFDMKLSDAQLDELHKDYRHLWDKLKTLQYSDDKETLDVLLQEPDNVQNYEAAFFTLQIRHVNDTFDFDQYAITINNKSTFSDSADELVLEISKFDTWDAVEDKAMEAAEKWIKTVKR
ncbi:hypothetical protein IV38_GL002051 [Lactobacillus selangorensis]|uniref:Uncharacterized protein n=1 Tax=Lactobacillus selangorensis TaxID=81857 RepID=A0A0R2FIU8_9LACO|nr:hypothetical protein [Lactobacillus selangorensis]KRN27595.1 hypothetical protein IV38_GL002051 [Lactobacillus selangorensis]KRN30132.1 hypothetical protein IV40_GL001978 [Lactobacillus selangorensis]